MSGASSAGKVPKAAPEAASLRVTTSCYGRPIPLGWGKFKTAAFLLWYGDFKAIANEQAQGGKGGSAPTSVSYTYESAVALGICEGQINSIEKMWKGKAVLTGVGTATVTVNKKEQWLIPAGLTVTVDNPATITAVVEVFIPWEAGNNYGIGGQTLVDPTDYTRSGNVFTFNAAFLNASVSITYSYSRTLAPVSPLGQANLTLFKGPYPQAVWSHLTTNHPTQALGYSGIAYAASAAYALGSSTDLPNTSFEVMTAHAYSSAILDVNPRDFVVDYLTNPYYGAFFPSEMIGDLTQYSNYCVASGLFLSPDYSDQTPAAEVMSRLASITNSDWSFYDDKFSLIPYADQAVTGNGKSFTPNLTAEYELGPDDFMDRGDSGPITIRRKDPNERYNKILVKFRNRANDYNDDIVEGKDEAEIGKNGLRPSPYDTECPEVKDKTAAAAIANILVQRCVNVCNIYQFKLKANKCGLVCMALVSLTHPDYFLTQQLVRIIEIDEDEDGALNIMAEEVPIGTASSINYPLQAILGYTVNYNAAPGNTSAPHIFEMPQKLTGHRLSLGIAAVGLGADWGGCEIWVSLNGTANYKRVGEIRGGSRYGTITAAFSGGTSVPVTLLAGQLLSGDANDAARDATLCYVAGTTPEYFSYQTATLGGPLAYTLTGCLRGRMSSGSSSNHANGDPFVRVDDRVVNSGPLDVSMFGQTVSVKLLSFNKYGGGLQTLADVSAYTYTITGRFFIADDDLNWDFKNGIDGWANVPYVETSSDASGGVYGVVPAAAGVSAAGRRIPAIRDRRYRVRCRISRPTGGTGVGNLYIGAYCLDAAGNAIVNTGGAFSVWCAALNVPLANDGVWRVFEGTIDGVNSGAAPWTNMTKLFPGTVYVQPIVFFDGTWNGAARIDYCEIVDITDSSQQGQLQFTAFQSWDFNQGGDGWAGTNLTLLSVGQSLLRLTPSGVSPIFSISGLNIQGRLYDKIRIRLRRSNSGTSWLGVVYYSTTGHAFSGSFFKQIPASSAPGSNFSVLEIDMADLTNGGTDWVDNAITGLRFDFAADAVTAFEVDWISVGRIQPGGDLALVSNSQWVSNDKMLQVGDTFTKLAPDGWDGQVYSVESYVGGAIISGIARSTAGALMIGLNTDPATDGNYTSIDFAVYLLNGGALQVYEGGTGRVPPGAPTFVAGDVLTVSYDGQFVRYLKNGVVFDQSPAQGQLRLYADSSFFQTGCGIAKLTFGPMTNTFSSRSGNLIDASWWTPGLNPIPRWSANQAGAGAADVIIAGSLPDGSVQPVWQATQGAGAAQGGGWNPSGPSNFPGNYFSVDPSKTYLFACYVRRLSGTANGAFWGTGQGVCTLNTSTPDTNPYFLPGNVPPVVDRWYLMIGWVYPAGTTGFNSLNAGMWDTLTGHKVAAGLNFNWQAGVQFGSSRAYQFYGSTGALMQFAQPECFLCDGSEPSLQDLLSSVPYQTTDALSSAGISGDLNRWTSTFPMGWVDWSGGGAIIKETELVRSGPYAARFQPAGADMGIWAQSAFVNTPRAVGEYLQGEIEMRIQADGGGGLPGVLVRLYTNSALSTIRDLFVTPTNRVAGEWQRMPFSLSVQPGERIYGIAFYLMAAWSGAPGGLFIGTVLFDNLAAHFRKQSDTLQLADQAATEVLSTNSASGTHNQPNFTAPAILGATTICSLSYTNNTGATVVCQLESSVVVRATGGGGPAGAYPLIAVGASLLPAEVQQPPSATENVFAVVKQISVAPGATFNPQLYAAFDYITSGVATGGDIYWRNATLRLSVIKK